MVKFQTFLLTGILLRKLYRFNFLESSMCLGMMTIFSTPLTLSVYFVPYEGRYHSMIISSYYDRVT